jgi:hypothetical protein
MQDLILYPQFFDQGKADQFFSVLITEILWQHESIKLFNKDMLQPRLTAYYGDKNYCYSGIVMRSQPWHPLLLTIKTAIEVIANVNFNAVLLNQYRDGNDSMGWHSDDEKELVKNSVIASLSLGETRRFMLRRKDDHQVKIELNLAHGDLLIMGGETQQLWQHQIPKTGKKIASEVKPRINLTFRVIKD